MGEISFYCVIFLPTNENNAKIKEKKSHNLEKKKKLKMIYVVCASSINRLN